MTWILLSDKYSCASGIIVSLRGLTLVNSPAVFCDRVLEEHTKVWIKKQLKFYVACE